MHTIMVVAGGLVLLALMAMAGKVTGLDVGRTLLWFIPVWLVCAALNMWVGVSRAGYTVAQEFPIFLLVFAVPAVIAFFLHWRFAR